MKIHQIKGGYDRNFSYLVVSGNEAVLIDPFQDEEIDEKLKNITLKYIINTHSHFDHTEGNDYYKKFGAEIVGFSEDELEFGKTKIKFIHTPGHTNDSMCILIEGNLFTGDTLFVGKVGGTGSEKQAKDEWDSLQKLMKLPDSTIIYPGHDYGVKEKSTVANEKKTNPFLSKDFKYFLWLKENWLEYKAEHGIK
ncbi:MBL fold metallo-hydrolase [Candidatus Woesearchaeota archaeon]|nr:MBL fold metallo-hydrolase [Candidatus Woesearchaeota archaeon]